MSEERTSSYRNLVQTPMNSSCRLCHYSGYSNLCTYFRGGECPYMAMKKSISGDRVDKKNKTSV